MGNSHFVLDSTSARYFEEFPEAARCKPFISYDLLGLSKITPGERASVLEKGSTRFVACPLSTHW